MAANPLFCLLLVHHGKCHGVTAKQPAVCNCRALCSRSRCPTQLETRTGPERLRLCSLLSVMGRPEFPPRLSRRMAPPSRVPACLATLWLLSTVLATAAAASPDVVTCTKNRIFPVVREYSSPQLQGCTAINLAHSNIGVEGTVALVDALLREDAGARITHMDLSWSLIKDAGAEAVAMLLRSAKSGLRSLNVSWNSFKTGGITLAAALAHNTVLQELSMEGCNAGDKLGLALATALSDPASALQRLNLKNTKLGAQGIAKVARALRSNTRLQQLQLQHSSLRDGGAAALGDGLAGNTGVTELVLHASKIGPAGVLGLVKGLSTSAVASLDLSGNRLCCDDKSAAMGEILGRLPGIAKLDVHGKPTVPRSHRRAS